MPEGARSVPDDLPALLRPEDFEDDVLDGLDRGELLARRFRHVAATALMVLRRPEGGRTKVGGLLWVSQRLYPLVKAACPDHPLLKRDPSRGPGRHPRRPDGPRMAGELARASGSGSLDGPSPFAAAWIDPGGPEALRFESPGDALRRLRVERLVPR